MKLVVDTNVLVSAFLWQGTPGRLVEMAGEKECYLFTSRVLLNELADVLQRKKLASIVTARRLAEQVSRDPDDDAVLACALAARADFIVSGDADLLVLKQFQGMRIVTAAQAVKLISS